MVTVQVLPNKRQPKRQPKRSARSKQQVTTLQVRPPGILARQNNGRTVRPSLPVALAVGNMGRTMQPKRTNLPNGGVRIHYKDYIGPVITSGPDFLVRKYPVNPGISSTFPWLNRQASQYEKYIVHSIKAHYIGNCSSFVNGALMCTFEMDAADPPPTNEADILNNQFATLQSVWEHSTSIMPTASGPRFTRFNNVRDTDIKTYDVANLFIATAGVVDPATIGRLFLEYDISLINPQKVDTITIGQFQNTAGSSTADPWRGAGAGPSGSLPMYAGGSGELLVGVLPGNSYLISMDLESTGTLSGVTLQPATPGPTEGNAVLNGTPSVHTSATGTTIFVVIDVIAVATTGADIGYLSINAYAVGGVLTGAGATFTISPWQNSVPFI